MFGMVAGRLLPCASMPAGKPLAASCSLTRCRYDRWRARVGCASADVLQHAFSAGILLRRTLQLCATGLLRSHDCVLQDVLGVSKASSVLRQAR